VVRRLFALISVLALAMPTAVLAQDPATDRFQSSPSAGAIDPAVLPAAMDDSRTVTVMVQLDADPVAVRQAEAGRKLSPAEKKAIRAEIKASQDALKDDIAARGGKVGNQLQSAYNGMRVNIARKDVASLSALPGVIGVRGLQVHTIDNATSVPYLGVPAVWQNTGFTGEGVKIGIIDTGLDYTHANFGGPGTSAAYELADANDTALGDAGDATIFGEAGSSKVKGGFDFAGDAYDADSDDPAINTPQPDPDPLDCQGHGSHVGGSAAGFGVTPDGLQYAGPYDDTTHANDFRIGPGVAPEADLYALRVFGCAGSTNLTVDAIDWAVEHDLDVINMSLGAPFGRSTDPSAVASTNAAASGVIVITSSGNSGPNPYITGSPGVSPGAVAVAAVDSSESFPGVAIDLGDNDIVGVNANGADLPAGSMPIHVLRDAAGDVSLGCDPQEYLDQDVAGKLVVTVRGTCARVARAVFGQQAGAAAVAMVNTDQNLPPFEGQITGNPDDPSDETIVTIPFIGVRGVLGQDPTDDGDALVAADGQTTTLTDSPIANPNFRGFASFSSGGPRNGDSAHSPNVAAPGVSIMSTDVGTGNGGFINSGTSMAAPHVTGVAALVRQAHPTWTVDEVAASLQNYADPDGIDGYRLTRGGTGLVDTAGSVNAEIVAFGDTVDAADESGSPVTFQTASLSFGFAELGAAFSGTKTVTVRNHGGSEVTLDLGAEASPQSAASSVSFSAPSVTVPADGTATVDVTLEVAANVGTSIPTQEDAHQFKEASGNVTLTSGETVLRVPYLLVPRALSDMEASLNKSLNPASRNIRATVTNDDGVLTSASDFYTWGLSDPDDVDESALGGAGYDLRAAGVQSFDIGGGDQLVVFAINNHDRWSTAAVNEYDVNVDTTGDGVPEFVVIGLDSGAVRTGSFDGLVETFLLEVSSGDLFATGFLASAPTDSSTVLLPIRASDLGLTAADGAFTYDVVSFSLEGSGVDAVGSAAYNPWNKAITDGQFAVAPPGGSDQVPVSVNNPAFAQQRPMGLMVVNYDNAAGAPEAQLIEAVGQRGR
jgi:subtilisin family serine protease